MRINKVMKNLFLGLLAISLLTACDDWWDGISNSGSGGETPTETQVVSLPTASTSSTSGSTTSAAAPAAEEETASQSTAQTTSNTESKTVAEPDLPDTTVAASKTSSSADKCGVGTYGFVTTKDNDTHFTGKFESGGRARYQLKGSPTGKWSLKGDKMDVYGPFKMPGRKYTTLHFTVTKRSSDCRVTEALGKSPGGSDLALRRR